jgi:hypothetical protein
MIKSQRAPYQTVQAPLLSVKTLKSVYFDLKGETPLIIENKYQRFNTKKMPID